MPRVRAWIPCEQYPSTPFCLLFDAILHANNIRDAADDRTARVRTLATALSPKAAQQLQLFLLFGPLAFVLIGVLTGFLPVWSLGTLLALPLLLRCYARRKPSASKGQRRPTSFSGCSMPPRFCQARCFSGRRDTLIRPDRTLTCVEAALF
ncbi:hypothetical protein BH20VER1_BH20VER1_04230 [soil metagenome]